MNRDKDIDAITWRRWAIEQAIAAGCGAETVEYFASRYLTYVLADLKPEEETKP